MISRDSANLEHIFNVCFLLHHFNSSIQCSPYFYLSYMEFSNQSSSFTVRFFD